ncbi:MAG: hypothetical protein KKG09_03650 [Verrucomicrobia bacterium]|nr:hypothetical protein [Verrucomicrobiota bacterium]MBU4247485.1 hypothetical protein [Verrucomicrobiota bacterium]MBU4292316.1 hypothetical protein [Verrucomicrobiota bacterium]MBU4497084.1 hypothetical protein [Verrucomicrobiota bacterium]MCG2678570.1 hypothetical protein [Kiritimatiellia bacterium]
MKRKNKTKINVIVPENVKRKYINDDGKIVCEGEMTPEYEKQMLAETQSREKDDNWNITEKRKLELKKYAGQVRILGNDICIISPEHNYPDPKKKPREFQEYWRDHNALKPRTEEEKTYIHFLHDSILVTALMQESVVWRLGENVLKQTLHLVSEMTPKQTGLFFDIVQNGQHPAKIVKARQYRKEKTGLSTTQVGRDIESLKEEKPLVGKIISICSKGPVSRDLIYLERYDGSLFVPNSGKVVTKGADLEDVNHLTRKDRADPNLEALKAIPNDDPDRLDDIMDIKSILDTYKGRIISLPDLDNIAEAIYEWTRGRFN